MKNLSMFIDESGDFDINSKHSPYYLFTLILHDQEEDINENIMILERHMNEKKFEKTAIHSAPLIRRERPYVNMSIDDRKVLFNQIYYFTRQCAITYKTFLFKKNDYTNKSNMISDMVKKFSVFIKENLNYFLAYDGVIVYYDNGQNEISQILNIVLNRELSHVEFRKVLPIEYRLFQVSDLICTIELLAYKLERKELSSSEKAFFYKSQELKKTYIKGIRTKQFK